MKKIGYARVSTDDQDLRVQKQAFKDIGCDVIFEEKISGKSTSRPELDRLMAMIRSGDTLIVYRLDRLGRSTRHLLEIVETLRQRDVNFVSLSEKFDTTTPNGKLIFTIMSAVVEHERALISERTKDTLRYLKSQGKHVGRREGSATIPQSKKLWVKHMVNNGLSIKQACIDAGISRSTYYREIAV